MVRFARTGLAAVVALGLAGAATASDYRPGWKKVTVYETVTTYVAKQEAYTEYVTKYDEYHQPYRVTVTKYRTVQVPVKKQVPVTKWVKDPDYKGGGY